MPNYTGQVLADWILAILGNVLIVGLAIGVVSTFMKSQWGQMFGLIAGGVVAGAFVWYPKETSDLLKALTSAIFATGA